MHSKKRELEVLVEEEARLGTTIQASQAQIQALIRTLADIDFLLGETRSSANLIFPFGTNFSAYFDILLCFRLE